MRARLSQDNYYYLLLITYSRQSKRFHNLDTVRTIDDVLEIGKIMNQSVILLAIDVEKAFDSLNHEFLYQVLQKMGFLQWIRTFYRNLSSCVLNNGFTTDIFFV